jgi:hypothetical protein
MERLLQEAVLTARAASTPLAARTVWSTFGPQLELFPEFQFLPQSTLAALFISKDQLPYPEAEGHLNNAGNQMVAKVLHDKLMAQPSIACALSERFGSILSTSAGAPLHPTAGKASAGCGHP